MKLMKLNFKNNNFSLINEILFKIFYISIGIVLIIAFISYINTYKSEKNKKLDELSYYVSERVRVDSEIFKLAEDNSKVFQKEFMKLYNSDIKVTKDEFWSYYFVDSQGATRMKKEYFDGIYTKDGNYIYGMSSFIGNNQKVDDADFQRRLVLSIKVLSKLGPAWTNRFPNVSVAFPENAGVLFYPGELWGLNAKADLRMNELGVIKSVNKKDNPERKSIWSGLYYDETAQKWTISYMHPVDFEGRHLITPGNDVYLSDLVERLIEKSADGTYNFIIRKDGYLIAHPNNPDDGKKLIGELSMDKISIPLVKEAYGLIQKNVGQDYNKVKIIESKAYDSYFAVGDFKETSWYLIRVLPMKNIRNVAHLAAMKVFIEGMAILFTILFIVYYVIKYQAERHLMKLRQAAEAVGRGEYDKVAEGKIELPMELKNEIGLLSRSFYDMSINIKNFKENLEGIVEERTKALEKANNELMKLSLLDGLTGIYNRRAFDKSINDVFLESKMKLGTFSIMMIDIDFFKSYNDRYGHTSGDEIIKMVANTFKDNVRKEGRVFRYGGEEFIAIFYNLEINMAKKVGEGIIKAIQNLNVPHEESPYEVITVSAGIAEYKNTFNSPEEIIKVVDKKLYMAKGKGRNCLEI
ncbi:sensor domain-containing diguanylate cyclase [Clostridium drakei]|uniref:Sensor domain-containing diguanylate cyclase n=2 Tax=Clostridium drakei TaxID=332101 RepID=A0A2U8DK09_9CLOT|nr:sensor domain-containing diguanylate cyclase [Clostridium drakei]